MSWTHDRIATLKQLWADGESASAIASRLGEVTRNAVIGKVHRLGLQGRRTMSRARRTARRPDFSPQRRRAASPHPRAGKPLPNATPRRPVLTKLAPAPDFAVTVASLTPAMCRWPEGDPKLPDFHFCGRGKAGAPGPYCGHHAAIAHR